MRMPISQIGVLGRITQGVRLINLKDNQTVSSTAIIDKDNQEIETEEQ